MINSPAILSIGTAVPESFHYQSSLLDIMAGHTKPERLERIKMRAIYSATGIEKRHFVIHDKMQDENPLFINSTLPERMNIFQKHAVSLGAASARECLEKSNTTSREITHLICFSCTGLYAPGLDIELAEALNLDPAIERTCINFMGCYAAFNAMKSAYYIAKADPSAKVLITGVELCSVHYQSPTNQDKMVANAIFSDGASSALISCDDSPSPKLSFKAFYNEYAKGGIEQMIWSLGDKAFDLVLGETVPSLIEQNLGAVYEKMLKKAGLTKDQIELYAIHPGGIKILQACEKALGIHQDHNIHSYDTLRNYGNMSSVTVMFVLNEHMKKAEMNKGKNILSCAFGPGLTMESMIINIC